MGLYTRVGKRALDVVGAGVAVMLTAPVLAVAAGAVRISMGSPVLFRQERPGKDERPFTMLKLRTMTNARSGDGALQSDAARLTTLGRFLRRTSIDELPELINVLRGDMSLVGPRPLLMEYLPRYDARQRRRHEVRPGITGLAQVEGRNAMPWAERFERDVYYVEHLSLALDVQILARTVLSVVAGTGISEPGRATMSRFLG